MARARRAQGRVAAQRGAQDRQDKARAHHAHYKGTEQYRAHSRCDQLFTTDQGNRKARRKGGVRERTQMGGIHI
eukprot:4181463-Pyramimonas_sp.AAC.1